MLGLVVITTPTTEAVTQCVSDMTTVTATLKAYMPLVWAMITIAILTTITTTAATYIKTRSRKNNNQTKHKKAKPRNKNRGRSSTPNRTAAHDPGHHLLDDLRDTPVALVAGVVVSSRCLRLASAPPSEHHPPLIR
jgi:hypothetical protein